MSWEALGAIGEISGSVAVVISLLYLAIQLRHTNRQSSSDAGFKLLAELNRINEIVFSDSDAAAVMLKLKTGEDLTPEEAVRAYSLADRMINSWYAGEISYRKGMLDEELFRDLVGDAARVIEMYPGLKPFCQEVLAQDFLVNDYEVLKPIFEQ